MKKLILILICLFVSFEVKSRVDWIQKDICSEKKDEVSEFFDSKQDTSGFAYVHVADDPAVTEALDPLKVTVRCAPMDWDEEPGKCLYTGKSVLRRSVISRSY